MATRARRLLLAELERQLCRSFPGVPASCAPFCPQAFRFLASAPLGRKSLVAQEHGRAKYLHSSSNLLGKFDVVIPPLGESISDGVIAAVLKRPGDAVAPDEPIAQIETDKVTIDIPAPASGVLAEILINKDDTVVVGQLVARINEGEGGEISGDRSSAGDRPSAVSTPVASSSETNAESTKVAAGRVPMIRFPPRMTADGTRISTLPAEEAKRALEGWDEGMGVEAGARDATAGSVPGGEVLSRSTSMSREAKVPHIGNGSLQVGVTVPLPSGNATHIRASSGPPRTPLSEAEIDAINLGGAEQGVAPKKKKATG